MPLFKTCSYFDGPVISLAKVLTTIPVLIIKQLDSTLVKLISTLKNPAYPLLSLKMIKQIIYQTCTTQSKHKKWSISWEQWPRYNSSPLRAWTWPSIDPPIHLLRDLCYDHTHTPSLRTLIYTCARTHTYMYAPMPSPCPQAGVDHNVELASYLNKYFQVHNKLGAGGGGRGGMRHMKQNWSLWQTHIYNCCSCYQLLN